MAGAVKMQIRLTFARSKFVQKSEKFCGKGVKLKYEPKFFFVIKMQNKSLVESRGQ